MIAIALEVKSGSTQFEPTELTNERPGPSVDTRLACLGSREVAVQNITYAPPQNSLSAVDDKDDVDWYESDADGSESDSGCTTRFKEPKTNRVELKPRQSKSAAENRRVRETTGKRKDAGSYYTDVRSSQHKRHRS